MFIHKVCTNDDTCIQGDENIAKEACRYFKNIFTGKSDRISEEVLNCVPRMVTNKQNQLLRQMPNMEELKQVVFSMNPNSALGSDGFGRKFYQSCWDIIKEDVLKVVRHFYCGNIMPKYFSHACLFLLPKIDHPNKFSEFIPISWSNFSNKIISKILCFRLAGILPQFISENQSGFVKGRSISENIMFAQEITAHYQTNQ